MIHEGDDSASLIADLPSEAATEAVGAVLAAGLSPGLVIYLCGDLGAGKTTLVRAVLQGSGYRGKVKSPTYTLVELYAISNLNLHHFDFYRFSQPEEYLDAGLDEYFDGEAVCLVEWPEKAAPYLPQPDLRIDLHLEEGGRRLEARGTSEAGRECIRKTLRGRTLPSP